MGIIRRSEYVKILEEAVSYIGYAVSQAKTGRYSVETRQFLYAESLMRMNHSPIGPVYPNRIQGRNRYRDTIIPGLCLWGRWRNFLFCSRHTRGKRRAVSDGRYELCLYQILKI